VDGEDEYTIMLQNHLDKFALINNMIVTNNMIPAGNYNFELAVNQDYRYNLNLIVREADIPIYINKLPVCSEDLFRFTIKDDINIGTTIGNINCTDPDNNKLSYNIVTIDKMIMDIVNVSSTGRVYIVNTPSTRKAIMGKYIIGVNVSDGVNSIKTNILISLIDDCYDNPCGNGNTCTDMFNTYICKCRNGFVGISCDPDYIKNVEASTADDSKLSNATMVGITFGIIVLIMIIVLLIVAVFRKTTNKTSDVESNKMITNPLFINPNNFNMVNSYTNPMYDTSTPLYNDGDFVVRENKSTPSWHNLSVRSNGVIYNDKIRVHNSHMNPTYELVANGRDIGMQPKHNTVNDLIRYYSTDRGVGYVFNQFNNPMYMDINPHEINPPTGLNELNSPALPLKNNQKDMIRSLANDDASEVYGNVADAKVIIINDMNI
jgi:hypothetical protein